VPILICSIDVHSFHRYQPLHSFQIAILGGMPKRSTPVRVLGICWFYFFFCPLVYSLVGFISHHGAAGGIRDTSLLVLLPMGDLAVPTAVLHTQALAACLEFL
jgi:hypothetical protein